MLFVKRSVIRLCKDWPTEQGTVLETSTHTHTPDEPWSVWIIRAPQGPHVRGLHLGGGVKVEASRASLGATRCVFEVVPLLFLSSI